MVNNTIDERINIVKLVNTFNISDSQLNVFLVEFRNFVKALSNTKDNKDSLMLKTIVRNEFEIFNLSSENIEQIVILSRSILKNKNKSFSNLLISLISNYINAINYDIYKHVLLYYPNNEYWDNINAIEINNAANIEHILSPYKTKTWNDLENTTITIDNQQVPISSIKIKTRNNHEYSKNAQRINTYRNTVNKEADAKKLKGPKRIEYIQTKISNFKNTL